MYRAKGRSGKRHECTCCKSLHATSDVGQNFLWHEQQPVQLFVPTVLEK